ncbi:MAG: BaiN/RdsA family NAD(P)/FAD-dependent oxidoreductase [Thermoplasmatota archaeon]
MTPPRPRVIVLGGGAAGFFGAIRAAERGASVEILEATGEPLQKVRISGGGRCNVTHAMFEPHRLVEKFPRGMRELRSVFARFQPRDTMAWFEARGVHLKVEADGRVFPVSDDSASIVDCLLKEAAALGIVLHTRMRVSAIERASEGAPWRVNLRGGGWAEAESVLFATGSNPEGFRLATSLGHAIEPPVPALFSLKVTDPRIEGLAGVAVPNARATLSVAGMPRAVTKEGPLLVTHQGFSAYAILRASSWAARELAEAGYRASLRLDFEPDASDENLRAAAAAMRASHPRGTVGAHPFASGVPRRLLARLAQAAGLDPETRWSDAPKKAIEALIMELKRGSYDVIGRGDFREEIVTCGGIRRSEINWTRMESRIAPHVHFAGEILDVDGLTGGFNLQNAWSTGWIAGDAMAGDT